MGGAGIRGRRSLHAVLLVLFVAASVGAFFYSSALETSSIRDAVRAARLAAQVKLAGVLTERDLDEPAVGDRYGELNGAIARVMPVEIDAVTLWSASGRVLYHEDPEMVGTRPTYPREFLGDVANGSTETKIEAGLLKTFVPVWVEPGGTIGVAQLDRSLAPVVSISKIVRIASGGLGLVALLLVVRAVLVRVGNRGKRPTAGVSVDGSGFRVGPRPMARPAPTAAPMTPVVVAPSAPKAAADGAQGASPRIAADEVEVVRPLLATIKPAPASYQASSQAPTQVPAVVAPSGRHALPQREAAPDAGAVQRLERERDEAVARAASVERALDDLRTEHHAALEQVAALEARLIVSADGPVHSTEDVQALRDQLRETADRLYRAEEENRALKVRVGEMENPLTPSAGLTAELNEIAHDRLTAGG